MSEGFLRRIHIRKESLKFSSAHMTVFGDGTKEALHGHNYRTELALELSPEAHDGIVPFRVLKDAMKEICARWDEKVLLAGQCEHFEIVQESGEEIEFRLCGKRYVLPRDEVEILPVENVVTETLAEEFCGRFLKAIDAKLLRESVQAVEIRIEEIPGQGASCRWARSE